MPKRGRESSDTLMAIDINKFNILTPGEQNRLGTPVRTTRTMYYFNSRDTGNVDELAELFGNLSAQDIIVVPPVVADVIQNDVNNEEDIDLLMSRMTIYGGKRSRRKSRRRKTKRARKSRRRRTHRRKRR
ncbi:hypothetical protein N9K75_01340 [bacterium]|nr:hypothetical protein [bacterium]